MLVTEDCPRFTPSSSLIPEHLFKGLKDACQLVLCDTRSLHGEVQPLTTFDSVPDTSREPQTEMGTGICCLVLAPAHTATHDFFSFINHEKTFQVIWTLMRL